MVIDSIAGILSLWDVGRSPSEDTSAQLSQESFLGFDSSQDAILPNYSHLCDSMNQKAGTFCDILDTFGAKIMDSNPDDPSKVATTRDCIQGLLGAAAHVHANGSSWQPVPRFQELCKQLSSCIHRFDAGSATNGKKISLPSIGITIQNPNFHYIKASEHYTHTSLRWCLKVSYNDFIPHIPKQMIFRSLDDFIWLWKQMKDIGNIDCSPDSLPRNNSFFGDHRYHHLEFMRKSHDKLQEQLNLISVTVMKMSNETCKQILLKWLEFNNSQELHSDGEILKHKQSQFSGQVLSFWQEAKSCNLTNALAASEELTQAVSAVNATRILHPFVEAVGELEALKTQIGSRKILGNFVQEKDVFSNYSVMQTLQRWRQDDRGAFDNFIQTLSSKFHLKEQSVDSVNQSRRNYKLEAQCIASIELAQLFMQSICHKMYCASFNALQSQLGAAGVVGTLEKVKTEVTEYLQRLQQKIQAGNYQDVVADHPNFACNPETEKNMKIVADSVPKLRRIAADC
jgi:hypothetical protein